MNMKRIVFAAGGILIMLVIIFFTLHSMAHIDEINQKRRDMNKGEAQASRIIMTTATTSIWDALREAAATEEVPPVTDENGEAVQETQSPEEENAEFPADTLSEENPPVPQTYTETVMISES